jgi:hypothetical protein
MKVSRLVVLSLVAGSIAGSARAQVGNCTQIDGSSRPDCPRAIVFFRDLQSIFREGDRPKVAALVDYPVQVSIHHKPLIIRDQTQLLAHFDQIFDKGVRCTILNGDEKEVWGNWRGFTVDGGSVWFDDIIPRGETPDIKVQDYWTKYPFKIKAINNAVYYPCDPAHKHKGENGLSPGSVQSNSKGPIVIVVSGPTVVAFFPSVTERDLSHDPDLNESLSDFQFSAQSVRGELHDAGIEFQKIYASPFGVKCGAKTKTFRPQKTPVGYYFVEPGKSPQVEYGAMTDADILMIAKKYFRPAPK